MNIDECYEKRRIVESAGYPDDIKLPFLAYGFYKPHQLAYSTIKGYVYNKEHITINNVLNHINGMPVLERETRDDLKVDAYIMDFKFPKRKIAYRTIGFGKNRHIYEWEVIDIEGGEVNVLMNASDKSDPIYSPAWDNYDWRGDPIFKSTLNYLDNQIDKFKIIFGKKYSAVLFEDFIEVQSTYMTLWTALDRFLTFRYGDTKTWNVKKLSKEQFFIDSLKKNYDALSKQEFYKDPYYNKEWKKEIFSTEDLTEYKLDPNKPTCSAMYYYTLRNNVVHAGKMMPKELNIVLNGLLGLTEIFRDVLKAVKKQ